ncbi:MAG: Na+/H+ antiporter NhaC family protein [Planctomycetes bacterium]|nr:Na+/H+ antiporter NhaC family protein [Planctomycetota bacterium]
MSSRFITALHRCRGLALATLVLLAAVLCVSAVASAQTTTGPADTAVASAVTPAAKYGLWALAPPLAAILLAIITRQVIGALFVGTLVASYMLLPWDGAAGAFANSHWAIAGVRVAMEKYVFGAVENKDHIQIMVFTMIIGAMVGVISANGGTRAMVDILSRWAKTSRRGQVAGWVGGHAIFFDDYANTMILGPTLRPLFDQLRISRAKLAYIVDSTAAPVASLVPIGTWIGFEVGLIDDGLEAVKDAARTSGAAVPEFLEGVSGYGTFLASMGYRFYAVFALVLVLIIALTRRDFGPMKRAEREALGAAADADGDQTGDEVQGRWWYAFAPTLLMVGLTVAILLITGLHGFPEDKARTWENLRYLLKGADPYLSILYGALGGLTLAILISVTSRTLSLRKSVDAGVEGMTRMFPAIVILILAWSLSGSTEALQLGEVASNALTEARFQVIYLPVAVFGAACVVSFATGSSWGTLTILCAVVVQIAARLCADLPTAQALPLFYSAVGAVLAGSIFGDHCSPISDTTVLSSIASSCRLEEHVWTQMPYALLAAAVSVGAGHYLCNVVGKPWWMGLLAGVGALLLVVLVIGRRPPSEPEYQALDGI